MASALVLVFVFAALWAISFALEAASAVGPSSQGRQLRAARRIDEIMDEQRKTASLARSARLARLTLLSRAVLHDEERSQFLDRLRRRKRRACSGIGARTLKLASSRSEAVGSSSTCHHASFPAGWSAPAIERVRVDATSS
jgi:hypothetical protein